MLRKLLLILLLAIALPLQAQSMLKPYTVKYTVHYNGFKVGEMEQSLRANGDDTYLLETVVYTTGLVSWFKSDRVSERSILRHEDGQFKPLSYVYHYTGRHKDVMDRLDFDWEKKQIKSLRDGKITTLALTPGIYDKQVYQLAMREELESGKKRFVYRVADRGKIEEYELLVTGEEPVVTSLGKVDTIKVEKGATTLWVAKAYDYTVVKIEKQEDGNIASSYIISKQP